MPSQLIQNTSGGDLLFSGYVGQGYPHRGIQVIWSPSAPGNLYIGLSGNITANSGTASVALTDGMPLTPNSTYFVPFPDDKQNSRPFQVWATADANCSGIGRVYWMPH